MNEGRLRRLRRDVRQLVERKRRAEARNAACPECGRQPLAELRFIHTDEEPCSGCESLIEQYGEQGRVYAIEGVIPLDPEEGPNAA